MNRDVERVESGGALIITRSTLMALFTYCYCVGIYVVA